MRSTQRITIINTRSNAPPPVDPTMTNTVRSVHKRDKRCTRTQSHLGNIIYIYIWWASALTWPFYEKNNVTNTNQAKIQKEVGDTVTTSY